MHADAPVWLLRLVRADPLGSVPQAVWPSLIELAQKLDVSGLVAHRALSAARPTNDELVETLRRQRQLAMRRTGFFSAEAARALEALDARGVVSLVLKGVSLARSVYEHPAERSFRDIDLLVAPEDVATALDALAEIGYSSKDTPAIQALYRRHHFHLILQGDGRPPLELHWALSRPDDPCGLDPSELFDGARASPGTPALRVVSPENQLLHVAVSEHRFGFTDLRRLIDFDRQLRAAQGLDWNELARRAASSGLSRPLRMCLELAGDLLHAPVAEGLAALPELGSARRRLSKLGIEAFPLQLPPSNVTAARLLVRFWLSDDRWRAFVLLLRTAPFERERLAVLGVPAHRRAAAVLARLLRLVSMAATSLATGVKPYRHHTLTSIASPPSSARPGADTARTREPRA